MNGIFSMHGGRKKLKNNIKLSWKKILFWRLSHRCNILKEIFKEQDV
jgi:hypothetical protein